MNGPGGVKNWFCEKVLNEVENGFCEKVQKVSKTGSVETEKVPTVWLMWTGPDGVEN